jgi:LuxR family maltose regulon positive regulatory protein
VATKLLVPEPVRERICRPSLRASLCQGRRARLILISAPAGYGKTTLLASWHADPEEERPFAWLSLDHRDNDPPHFWRYVLAALRTVADQFGVELDDALSASGAELAEHTTALLVNALAELPRPIVLVLDDYHEIDHPSIHRSLGFLIDRLPATIQIALASRGDPPLPLARSRARAELLELRTDDLRLTLEEAERLLNGSMRLALEPAEIRILHERTEGWAAGLQLAGCAVRGRADRSRYVSSFRGDDRQIAEYLEAEVLDRQGPDTRRFLARTSILERLCAPLCDAVLNARDSARTLMALDRANLFIVPLDGRRAWYRYHPLFRDLLERELRLAEPELIAGLHERACDWHTSHGLVPDADRHARRSEAGEQRPAVADASRRSAVSAELSQRELAVLRLLPTQLSLREIGDELYVSINTVKTHARNVYAKLRVGSRADAVARARELRLL